MNNKKTKSIMMAILSVVMSMVFMVGCAKSDAMETNGGVITVSVNPKLAIYYNEKGIVKNVVARNDDAEAILKDFSEYKGKETREVISDLVVAIGDAGYFVEEIEGKGLKITIDVEEGSNIPYNNFLNEVVSDIQECVKYNDWNSSVIFDNDDLDDLYDIDDDQDDIYDDRDDIDDDKDDIYDDRDDIDDDRDDIDNDND